MSGYEWRRSIAPGRVERAIARISALIRAALNYANVQIHLHVKPWTKSRIHVNYRVGNVDQVLKFVPFLIFILEVIVENIIEWL